MKSYIHPGVFHYNITSQLNLAIQSFTELNLNYT